MPHRIYIAGPLFSEAEREFNRRLSEFLEGRGYETFLPQRDGDDVHRMLASGLSWTETNQRIFDLDMEGLGECDAVVFVMDGRVPDEGACVEIGYAYGLGIECYGLKTDCRTFMGDYDNPMIIGALRNRIARDRGELIRLMEGIER
ncbi:MAG: nucleoside 2-deoxyribosyltransferase [Methanomassiliicoccales archaeon]